MLDIVPMNDKVKIKQPDGLDEWGIAKTGDPEEVNCHFRYNTEKNNVIAGNGEEVTYTADIYLYVAQDIGYKSTVVFEDDNGHEIEKKPLSIHNKKDYWGTAVIKRVVV